MANNTVINTGTGGDTIRDIDRSGVKTQIVALDIGGAASETLVDATTGLPSNVLKVGNTSVSAFPAGFQRTTDEPHQVFYDPFDSFDTTDRWNTGTAVGGGVAAAVTAGVMTLGSGTTINGYSYLTSRASFVPTIPAWLGNSWAIQIESGGTAGANAVRFWGCGIIGGTPSSTTPLGATGNGFGFELDVGGVLQAVVYASGTRTVVSSLATFQPTDGAYHRYICYYRTDKIYWYIDGLGSAQLAATSNFQGPNIQTLPLLAMSIADSSAPAASRVITCAGLAVWDTGKNNNTLSDGIFGWRKATVKPGSVAAVATDSPLVVTTHPSSAVPVGATATGSYAVAGNGLTLAVDGRSGATISVSGTWVGVVTFQASNDGGATYPTTINAQRAGDNTLTQTVTNTAGNDIYRVACAGFTHIRAAVTTYTSGTVTITAVAVAGTSAVVLSASLPAGTNTIGAVSIANEGAATFRGRSQTFRIPGLAGTTGQKLFAIHNATGSTKVVHINQINVDLVVTVVKAVTVAPPIIRIHRITVVPSGGTAGDKVKKDTALTSNASVTTWQGASADGTGTSLTVTIPANNIITQEFAPRLITAVGYEGFDRSTYLEGFDIVLRALEGICVELVYTLATQNPITDMWIVGCDWWEI